MDAALRRCAWNVMQRESRVARPFASECRARRQPGRCQKRLLTEIVTFIFYNSVLINKTTTFYYYHVYHLCMRLNPVKYFSSIKKLETVFLFRLLLVR